MPVTVYDEDHVRAEGMLTASYASLRHVVALCIAQERERCAKIAEEYNMGGAFRDDTLPKGWRGCRRQIADAIRKAPEQT